MFLHIDNGHDIVPEVEQIKYSILRSLFIQICLPKFIFLH